jgi:hypothetical protein
MKRALVERNLVVVLFILVLVIFSLAERDSKKMEQMYNSTVVIKKSSNETMVRLQASASHQQ